MLWTISEGIKEGRYQDPLMGQDTISIHHLLHRLVGGCLHLDRGGAERKVNTKYLLKQSSKGALVFEGWVQIKKSHKA